MGANRVIFILCISCFIGSAVSGPPLREISPEFESFEEVVPLHRLPQVLVPNHYQVELQPILDEGHGQIFTAPGKVSIIVACRLATNNITLHALTLNISQSSVKIVEVIGGVDFPIESFEVDTEKDFFIIHLVGDGLRAGGVYVIYIEFVAPVSRDHLLGLYLSNYTASDGTTRYLAVTDLEATDARRVFPCFDEPAMKATFDISIIRLPKYHSLSNMNLIRTETTVPGLPNWVKDVYERTELMSTYLFCVAVSDFAMEEAGTGHYSKPVKVWGPPPYMESGAGQYSPNITAKLMAALEAYFRVPYTFPKMDKIAVPHFGGGAMENWGLNTYKLNRLLLEDGIATAADKISTTITLSHELAHQWFGNLVTMQWWDDLWLNEGFASYYSNTVMMDIGAEDMLPLDTLVTDAVHRAMAYDLTSATHPIHFTVETPTEIRIMFDTVTYSKGAAIVRMLDRLILGETNMRNGITAYLQKFSHKNAHQDDLFECLQEEISSLPENILPNDLTLKGILDTWTLQSGFPILSVLRVPGSSRLLFSQEKAKTDSLIPGDPTAKWHIPIEIKVSSDSGISTGKIWLKATEASQSYTYAVDNANYFIVNPQQFGYYRVKYEVSSLRQIIEQLHQNHEAIDVQTRSSLVDDNLNLAYGGYVPLADALNLTLYLKNERHLAPWTAFVTNMAKPYRFLGRTAGISAFKKYVVNLLKDTLAEIKLDPQPSEPIGNATILRNRLFEWACNLGDSDCIQYSQEKFADWMRDPSNNSTIFPDLRPFVYCTAVANGGESEWNFTLAQYKVANRDVTRVNLIRSLGCSKSAYKLTTLLNLAIDPASEIESAHRVTAMQAVAGNSIGVDIAFNFIRNNLETIRRRFGVSMIASVVTTLSNTLNKAYDIADLQRFILNNEATLAPVNGTLQNAIGNIEINVRWMSRNAAPFREFVEGL